MITILSRLLNRQPEAPLPPAAEAPDAADERLLGCGWFDSSHELTSGLMVTEHLTADAVAAQLPLGDWLELHLGGWCAPCAAA